MGVYTVSFESGFNEYIIYEPVKSKNMQVIIEYTLNDAIVQHNDCSEFFWSFIDQNTKEDIKNLTINIFSNNIIDAYTYGNISSETFKIAEGIQIKSKNVKPREIISSRVVMNRRTDIMIHNTHVEALELIEEIEQYYLDKKDVVKTLNIITIIFAVVILIYWLFLLYEFEIEDKPLSISPNAQNILNKYNPMIAACMAQNRGMHPRDILAVLVDLVNIKALKMEYKKGDASKENQDKIIFTQNASFFCNSEELLRLDIIQLTIINIFFGDKRQIELMERLKQLYGNPHLQHRLKKLDKIVTRRLNAMGINSVGVPTPFRVYNTFMLIFVCIYIILVTAFNTMFMNITTATNQYLTFFSGTGGIIAIIAIIIIAALIFFPITLLIINLIVGALAYVRHTIESIVYKRTSQKLIRIIALIVVMFLTVLLLEVIVFKNITFILTTILFFMALLVALTDNLMATHSKEVINEYAVIKMLQDKIEKGSMLKEKGIEHNILWSKYYTFAVALGVSDVEQYSIHLPDFSEINEIMEDFYKFSENCFSMYNTYINTKEKLQKYFFKTKNKSLLSIILQGYKRNNNNNLYRTILKKKNRNKL